MPLKPADRKECTTAVEDWLAGHGTGAVGTLAPHGGGRSRGGSRVAIAGHTHAAQYIRLDAQCTNINTGTWSDLILCSDEDAKVFIDELEANKVPVQRQLTWVLVDEGAPSALSDLRRRLAASALVVARCSTRVGPAATALLRPIESMT